jgi:hypothetical protein
MYPSLSSVVLLLMGHDLQVDDYVIYRRRLLTIDTSKVREVEVSEYCILLKLDGFQVCTLLRLDGKKYSVPVDVSVTSDNQVVRGEYITYRTGSDAANQFNADASYPLRYFAVSGTTSGAFAARKSFLSTHQYAFFSYTEGSYSARLRDYGESLNEGPLVTALTGVPPSFDSSDSAGVGKYKEFFRDHGSHVIINAGYGARYPLVSSACVVYQAANAIPTESVGFKRVCRCQPDVQHRCQCQV